MLNPKAPNERQNHSFFRRVFKQFFCALFYWILYHL